ncbi:MAG: hypothetical protein WAM46_10335 [Flavobacterium sp.]
MNKYTVLKWEKLLLWLIPPILRKKTHVDWLDVLLTPLHTIYGEILYKMQHTGQVIYLEKVLNDTYNPTKIYNPNLSTEQKRVEELIYIDESVKPTLQYVFLHKEYYEPDGTLMIPQLKVYKNREYKNRNKKPVYLAHLKDYTKITYANFRVFIPQALIANLTIVVEPNKDGTGQTEAIKVANIEYHNLLNFYKLAGKSYESYSYSKE